MERTTSSDNAPLCGLVLAGGQSKRMGHDKAAVAYQGKPQVEVCFELLQRVCDSVFVSTRADQADAPGRKGLPQIHDRFGHIGPMDGILSAFETHPDRAWLVVACDLPFLNEVTLRSLIAQRDAAKDATAFVSSSDGLPEPLCAIYEPRIRAKLQALLSQDMRCPRKALIRSDTKLLKLPDERALDNVNNPEELDAALKALSTGRKVTINYYAQLREQRGLGEEAVETTAATARDLYQALRSKHGLQLDPKHVRVAVNQQVASWDAPVRAGDRIAFLPPVSGG